MCPVNAISTGPMKINIDKCISCGKCFQSCPGKKIVEIADEEFHN